MSQLIPLPPAPTIPAIESFALNELAQVNAAVARRVEEHRERLID